LLALQRTAGNASVVALLGSPAARRRLGRAPKELPLQPHVRARAEHKGELRQAVRDLEAELDREVSVWEDTIRKAGDEEIRRARGVGAGATHLRASPPGSYKDRLDRREWVRRKLEELRDGGGDYSGEARQALGHLDEIEGRLEGARGELARAGRRDAFTTPKPPRGGDGGGGGASSAGETARAEERAALDAEAELAKGVLKGEASLLTRMTMRITSFIADMLPGPLELLQLVQGFSSGYQGAWDSIRDRNTREGFAAGYAACLLLHEYGWVRAHLFRWEVNADSATVAAGAEGMAERAYNEALLIGYEYCENRSVEHLAKLRDAVFKALARDRFSVAGEEDVFSERTVREVSVLLMPSVADLFNRAARLKEQDAAAVRAVGERKMAERWETRFRP
jgi:hypothetical protein